MTVKQDKRNGKWTFEFMINGKRYHRCVPEATNKREAEKAEAVLKGELLQGRYRLAEGRKYPKLSKLIEVYLDYSRQNKTSYKTDEYTTSTFLAVIGDKNINEITPLVIERWKKYRKNCKAKTTIKNGFKELDRLVSKSAINREMRSLSKMFSIAVDNDWLDYNPFFKVPKFREENASRNILRPEDEVKLLKVAEGSYIRSMIICALHTGMRIAEIKQLKWSCVNLEEGYIDVLKTKSGKPRQIAISEVLFKEFKRLEKLSAYVFTNPKTLKPYVNIRDKFMDICSASGITGLTPYSLRHTAATRMVQSGIDLSTVQDILGHANLKITQRYSHPVPERKKQAIDALNSYYVSNINIA